MLIFGAVHLFLFTSNPFLVAFLATGLAIAAAFPFAFLYERAGNTIWAGVILHVGAHAFRLVDIPEAQILTVASVGSSSNSVPCSWSSSFATTC